MTDLATLAKLLDEATEPDQELDADIAEASGFRINRDHYTRYTQEWAPYIYDWHGCNKHPMPKFTSSIDAALALMERVLPGCSYDIGRTQDVECYATVYQPGMLYCHKVAPTLALALLKATVAAKMQEDRG